MVMTTKDKITPKIYNELKKRAFAFEKNDHSSIIVFPARGDGSWYRVGGNSALFYQFLVMDELGLSVNIKADDDYRYKFESGINTINFNQMVTSIKEQWLI